MHFKAASIAPTWWSRWFKQLMTDNFQLFEARRYKPHYITVSHILVFELLTFLINLALQVTIERKNIDFLWAQQLFGIGNSKGIHGTEIRIS